MTTFFAKQALLSDGWHKNVKITIGQDGTFSHILPDQVFDQNLECFGIIIPPQISLHSHAFQRAMAGLAETKQNPEDTFWTWRTLMYKLAHRITPEQMQAIASFLYMQMLKSGYAHVAEFHYLHNDKDGSCYSSPAEMSHRLAQAATTAGIGLTLLPTLYERGDMTNTPLSDAQKRFASTPDTLARIISDIQTRWDTSRLVGVGIGLHSLRAVDIQNLGTLLNTAGPQAPIHIHIAEQQREVEECLAITRQRPVEYLFNTLSINERWCLVHATHLTSNEISYIAQSQAVAGICPITEANLGDGIFPFEQFTQKGGRFGIGSDSNILITPWEELRLLEYGLRLSQRKRCITLPKTQHGSIGRWLYTQSLQGGAQACRPDIGKIAIGYQANLCVLDETALSLPGLHGDAVLDSAIFATASPPILHVMSAGEWRIRNKHHADEVALTHSFEKAIRALMA